MNYEQLAAPSPASSKSLGWFIFLSILLIIAIIVPGIGGLGVTPHQKLSIGM